MNIYQLTTEAEELYNALLNNIDEETGEVDSQILAALEGTQEAFREKAVNIALIIRMFENKKAEIRGEIQRLQALEKKVSNNIERLSNNLSSACLRLDMRNIADHRAVISFRKSEQTIIYNADDIPQEYIKEKIEKSFDKIAIKAAIKSGVEVAGAKIETVQNIQIK